MMSYVIVCCLFKWVVSIILQLVQILFSDFCIIILKSRSLWVKVFAMDSQSREPGLKGRRDPSRKSGQQIVWKPRSALFFKQPLQVVVFSLLVESLFSTRGKHTFTCGVAILRNLKSKFQVHNRCKAMLEAKPRKFYPHKFVFKQNLAKLRNILSSKFLGYTVQLFTLAPPTNPLFHSIVPRSSESKIPLLSHREQLH